MKNNSHNIVSEQMKLYYLETAKYYTLNPESMKEPDIPSNDNKIISKYLDNFGEGHLIDIGCGNGVWVPKYYRNIKNFSFLDSSKIVLELCKARVKKIGLIEKSLFINCDVNNYKFPKNYYDAAFVGFLISHFDKKAEYNFLIKMKETIKPNGRIAIVDSIFTREIYKARRVKRGIITRKINGKTYNIYKNYFIKDELETLLQQNGFVVENNYFGSKVVFVIARNLK